MEIYRFIFSPIEVNTFILTDETGSSAIIDCGCYDSSEFGRLAGWLDNKGLEPELLLNTHCHLDHIFGNNYLLEKYGLKAVCHELEEPNRNNALNYAAFWGLTMDPPPEPGSLISEGQEVAFGNTTLRALHVPGHSAGSLAFYSEKDNVVFTGDALFAGGIGRTDLPGGDYRTLITSIKEKLFILPPETVVWPGHGEKTTVGAEINSNPYFINT